MPVVRGAAHVLLDVGRDQAPALVGGDQVVTYAALRERVADRLAVLGLEPRSLVVLDGGNDVETVVTYLALLAGGHVPLLAARRADRLAELWHPAAAVRVRHDELVVTRPGAHHELHPDLALLLSTSGSTGSPKLVRLSHANVVSNARSISQYLRLSERDRGITSLPLHYCYGLSVLHSHLVAGASVVLTEASVVDPCFHRAVVEQGVTSIAGVPHTFELLERVGPEHVRGPSLRLLTQAGGRLAPGRVQRWLDRADAWGVDFVVMYGQTEATARMAYLPPHLARQCPSAIGVPIPGGSLAVRPVDDVDDPEVGELVYRGPNVMMGYATDADHLARGAELDELRTGDLGRYRADLGVFEVVGRRSRFVKPFGLRIDLEQVETGLRSAGIADAVVVGDDERLAVLVPSGAADGVVRDRVVAETGLPAGLVHVLGDRPVPRTESGKVDHAAVLAMAPAPIVVATPASGVAAVFASVLARARIDPTDTFVGLGGDSLSYVECSLRLEQLIGRVPVDWHLRPVAELDALTPTHRSRWIDPAVDTTVVLRAFAICAVVATHMRLWFFPGGAHLMLALVGFNLARFQLELEPVGERIRSTVRSLGRIVVPTVLWVGAGMMLFGAYSVGTLLLVNNYAGPEHHRDDHWHFWFFEVMVHLVVITTLLLAVAPVRRCERRFPYVFPLVLLGLTGLSRFEWAWAGHWYNIRFQSHTVAFVFVLGWLAQRSDTRLERVLTSVLAVASMIGFFHYLPREVFIASALVLLVWCRSVPLPRPVVGPVAVLAAASMWIYITHFTVWPLLQPALPIGLAYVLTVVGGVAASRAAPMVGRVAARWVRIAVSGVRRVPAPPERRLALSR